MFWNKKPKATTPPPAGYTRTEPPSIQNFYKSYAPVAPQTPTAVAELCDRVARATRLARRGDAYPVDPENLAGAAEALREHARELFGATLDLADGDPAQLDRLIDHLVDPRVKPFFHDGTLRPDLSESEQEAYATATEALEVPGEPLLYYALGAFHGEWLVRHRKCAWALYPPLNPVQSFPDMITCRYTVCLHPFSQVNKRFSDPAGDNLAFKVRVIDHSYVPPLPLLASLADADHAATQLLPPAAHEGLQAQQAGDHHRAMTAFVTAMKDQPRNAQLLSLAVASAFPLKEYGAAEAMLNRILEDHPDLPMVNHNLAVLHSMSDRLPSAVDLLRKAIAVDPSYARARITLASCLAELGHRDEAIEHVQWVVDNDAQLADEARRFLKDLGA